MKLISISKLKKNYQTKEKEIESIKDLTFDIYESEIVSIIGPSGCGKSTLLNILTKLENITDGKILEHKKIKIGYMLQNDCLLPWLTVKDNALLGLKLKGIYTKENILYVEDLLNKYGLKDFSNLYPNNLSGGMKQRLSLIRTLATKPNILLLDEPFSKLDYYSKEKIIEDIHKIIKELNITTLLITHDIKEAITLSDRIIVLTKRPCTIKNIYKLDEYNKDNLYEIIRSEIDSV